MRGYIKFEVWGRGVFNLKDDSPAARPSNITFPGTARTRAVSANLARAQARKLLNYSNLKGSKNTFCADTVCRYIDEIFFNKTVSSEAECSGKYFQVIRLLFGYGEKRGDRKPEISTYLL